MTNYPLTHICATRPRWVYCVFCLTDSCLYNWLAKLVLFVIPPGITMLVYSRWHYLYDVYWSAAKGGSCESPNPHFFSDNYRCGIVRLFYKQQHLLRNHANYCIYSAFHVSNILFAHASFVSFSIAIDMVSNFFVANNKNIGTDHVTHSMHSTPYLVFIMFLVGCVLFWFDRYHLFLPTPSTWLYNWQWPLWCR